MDNFYIEKEKQLPVFSDVDVLVCGGGPAGIGAAFVAAKEGVKTMIIERLDCLGGMATAGMMSHWGGKSSSKVLQDVMTRTREKCDVLGWKEENDNYINAIHHDAQKIVLDEMAKEYGIEVLYYTTFSEVIKEGDRVVGAIVENKTGRGVIKAKYIVDATGDGDVAFKAGVPFTLGREEDNKMQPATIMFKIGGVDYSKAIFPPSFESLVNVEKGEIQALGKSILPFPAGHVLLYRQPTPDTVCVNMTNSIGVDGTNAKSVTDTIMECRSQIEPIVKFLKEYAPGYENCWLMSSGSLVGIRETRHFEGLERIEKDDVLTARYYDNWVVRHAFFNFDVHNITGHGLDKTGIQHEWKQWDTYTIPFGCILPKKIEGVLLSGRNISGSHMAHSNFRIMSVCCALGEAAGATAAIAVKENLASAKDVDVAKIQAIVGDTNYRVA